MKPLLNSDALERFNIPKGGRRPAQRKNLTGKDLVRAREGPIYSRRSLKNKQKAEKILHEKLPSLRTEGYQHGKRNTRPDGAAGEGGLLTHSVKVKWCLPLRRDTWRCDRIHHAHDGRQNE